MKGLCMQVGDLLLSFLSLLSLSLSSVPPCKSGPLCQAGSVNGPPTHPSTHLPDGHTH